MSIKIIALLLVSLLTVGAHAQTAPTSYAGLDHINRLIGNMGAPGNIGGRLGAQFAANAIGPGGMATVAGDTLIKPSGLSVPVGMRVALPAGRMASIAGACMSGGVIGPLGCAFGVAMIGKELKDHGVFGTCPDGSTDLFCKKAGDASDGYEYSTGIPGNGDYTASGYFTTKLLACQRAATVANTFYGFGAPYRAAVDASGVQCQLYRADTNGLMFQASFGSRPSSCGAGRYMVGGVCKDSPDYLALSRQELIDELNRIAAADYAANQRILQEMQKDVEARGGLWPYDQRPVRADDPVTVETSPVESPAKTTKVTTIPRPDGSTDTETTTEKTKVTPTTSGSTVGTVKVDFPSSTTTTTTTVNSVTNQSTTTTTVVNNPLPTAEPRPLEIPDDYNKEVTQQKILTGDDAPDMPDQQVLVDDAKTKSAADLDDMRKSAEVLDKSPWFSWVWTPPSGTCTPFAGSVHGYAISWDVCPTVENIRDVLGWLFAIFAAIEIYGQLFRNNG